MLINATKFRNNFSKLLSSVLEGDREAIVIGRHDNPEAVLIKFPNFYNKNLSDITNVNTYSSSFDFLHDEPELYSKEDVKVFYEN